MSSPSNPFFGKRILVFGDSLSNGPATPGGMLADKFARLGSQLKVRAADGRALSFFNSDTGWILLQESRLFEPHLVLLMMGTNDSPRPDPITISRSLGKVLSVYGKKVIALGPPAFFGKRAAQLNRGAETVVEVLRNTLGDNFRDTRHLSADLGPPRYRRPDGIHFTAEGAGVYSTKLFQMLTHQSGPRPKGSPEGAQAAIGLFLLGLAILKWGR